jgi:hypothetical protein
MNNKVKLWFAVSLIVVFLAGLSGGILIDKLNKPQSKSKTRRSPAFPSIEMMAEELGLTPEQQAQIQELFKQNDERLRTLRHQIHEQFGSLRSNLKSEMNNILDESQQKKLEAMIEKYSSQRTGRRGHRTQSHRDNTPEKGVQK